MDVSVRNSTNLVTSQEDTTQYKARFCLQQDGSYIGIGELEQIASDSLLLLVSKKLHRMIVYTHHSGIADQLQHYLGLQLEDSSLLRIAGRYTALARSSDKDMSAIEVNSRGVLYNTSIPKETITVRYSSPGWQPSEVVQVRRSLVPVSKAVYDELSAGTGDKSRLLLLPDSSYCVVKEQVSSFEYGAISHAAGVVLPARVSDRIVMDAAGSFHPVKAYDDFLVTQDL
jgi:hypothetical protein